MLPFRLFLALLSLLILGAPLTAHPSWAGTAPAASPQPAASTVKPAPLAAPAVTLAPIATQLGKTLQSLVGVPSTQPAASTATAATPAAAPPDTGDVDDSVGQITDSFATTLLTALSQDVEELKKHSDALALNVRAIPDLINWVTTEYTTPRHWPLWQDIEHDLLIIVGVPMLGAIAIALILWPIRRNLRRKRLQTLEGKFFVLMGVLLLRLSSVVIFLGASLLLLGQNESHNLPRFVVLNIIYAIASVYAVRLIARAVFAPRTPSMRLIPLPTPLAVLYCTWVSIFGGIIVGGYFVIADAYALRMPESTIALFENSLALVLIAMAIFAVIHMRARVAAILVGHAPEQRNLAHGLRATLAAHWHQLAIAYMVIGFVITVLGINNGFALLLRGTLLTLVILGSARLGFLFIENWKDPANPALAHRQILAFLLRPMLWIVVVTSIAATWGFQVSSVIATPVGQRVASAFLSVAVTLLILTVLYEFLNAVIERHINRRDPDTKAPVASARARTLLPMVRNTIFILFAAITLLTLLSAVGINMAPVLAGAGVLGVAIGFGSQTLVKDFLTGLFIVTENTVAVGDIVKIGDFGGVVEAMSIRTIQLRDYDGSLHILPFGDVSKITNMTKGYSFAVVDIGVAYDSDLDRVMQVIREVGAALQEDPVFKRVILEPIEVAGVETLGDSSITVRARIRTRPGKQWDVKRLLLQRIKERFDTENIEIPFPIVTHITKAL
ncbi:MAG: mechanosensitive ion channel [Alphaproteobacteria bacterium]|nr:mechanosensitive ion channel [Alphaproteobacteria bacterium]